MTFLNWGPATEETIRVDAGVKLAKFQLGHDSRTGEAVALRISWPGQEIRLNLNDIEDCIHGKE